MIFLMCLSSFAVIFVIGTFVFMVASGLRDKEIRDELKNIIKNNL